ncbi:MAG: glycosyltransferase [Anaerolineae bacterium]|nr:glycosyltransferase [Anaerolineae bacterium]
MSETPLQVLMISRCPPYPLHLGDRLIPYHIVRELAAQGVQVDLLAYYQHDDDPDDLPFYAHLFRQVTLLPEPARSPSSLIQRAALPTRRFPRSGAESWSPAMWDAIAAALATTPYDVVHLFGGVHVYEFRALVEHLPNVITPYESFSLLLERTLARAESLRDQATTRALLSMARQFERWMFRGYDRVVVVSDRDAETLRGLAPGLPLAVIPNGVDLETLRPTGQKATRPTLVFTGNYEYAPNLDAAFVLIREIFPLVRAALPEAELLIVGANPPPELLALAGDGVQVTGHVPELAPYLDAAHVYVCPLRVGAGIKNKVLAAMAMRTPVIGTPLSFDGIAVTPGEDVLTAETPDEFAAAILRLLREAALRDRLAAGARACIERRYTWRAAADSYAALYRIVIEAHERA